MRNDFQPIPKPIVKAISAVQQTVEAVAKTQFNKMGGYKFASADDIYAAVTRRMGQVGLVIMVLELEPPKIERIERDGKTAQWARFRFGFALAVDDETWFDERSSRTLFIQLLGPQTFNAAESYAQKQYLRGLLKLPTGDMDLDSMPTAETVEDQVALSEPRKRKSSASAKKDGTTEVFNDIRRAIKDAVNADMLRHLRETYSDEWSSAPTAWAEILDNEYEDRMTDLGATNGALL